MSGRNGGRDILFWFLYYVPWVSVLLRLLLDVVPDLGLNPATAVLLGAFLVLAVCQPLLIRRMPAYTEPCMILQVLLIAALLFTYPRRDFHAILVLSICLIATRYLPAGRDLLWLAVCCAAPTAALLGAFGFPEGLQYVPGYLAGVLCLGLYGRESRRADEARARSEALAVKLRAYAEQAQELAAAQERNRLARELHDAVTQTIFGVTLTAEAARMAAERDPGRVPALLGKIQESSADALAELRAIVAELRPARLVEDGLVPSLRRHCGLRERRERLRVDLRVEGEERGKPEVLEALYRTVQEALNNVVKHAGTDSAVVELRFADGEIRAAVRDAGKGFDPGAPSAGGFGLATMRERIEGLGGALTVTSRPGSGTEVAARLPLADGGRGDGQDQGA